MVSVAVLVINFLRKKCPSGGGESWLRLCCYERHFADAVLWHRVPDVQPRDRGFISGAPGQVVDTCVTVSPFSTI